MFIRRSLLVLALAAAIPFAVAQDSSVKENRNASAKTGADAAATTNTSSKTAVIRAGNSGAKPAATGDLLDLNTATPDQLKALPGLGDAYTKRIIDGRPYTAKNQIVQRGIVPQKTYDGIKDKIVAHRPAAKK